MMTEPEICPVCTGRGTVPMGSQRIQCGHCYGTMVIGKQGTGNSGEYSVVKVTPDWPSFQIWISYGRTGNDG